VATRSLRRGAVALRRRELSAWDPGPPLDPLHSPAVVHVPNRGHRGQLRAAARTQAAGAALRSNRLVIRNRGHAGPCDAFTRQHQPHSRGAARDRTACPALEAELQVQSGCMGRAPAECRQAPTPTSTCSSSPPGQVWENLTRAYRVLHAIAGDEGVNPMRFALQVFDETGRRAIKSFFVSEVDRDKVVLAGQP